MFKKAYNYIKRKNKMINNFMQYSNFLQSGNYKFSNSMNYIYLKNREIEKKAKNMFDRKSKKIIHRIFIDVIRRILFNKDIVIENTKNINVNKFYGTVYLPANNNIKNKDAKIFDFDEGKVLSIHSVRGEYINNIEHSSYFRKFFRMPEILWHDNKNLLLVEEIINFKSNKEWLCEDYKNVINIIFKAYINYFNEYKRTEEYMFKSPIELLNNIKIKYIKDFLKDNISINLLNYKFPFVKVHGDLWSPNILINEYNEDDIYIIDWEHSDYFILFYDLFFLMQDEAIYNDNYLYLKHYIDGQYDCYLKEMFLIFDIDYNSVYRIDYLVIFFINVFETRLIDRDKRMNDMIFKRFENLLRKIKSSKI